MVWAPDYIKKQIEENPPRKPFSKTKATLSKQLHSKYPKSNPSQVTTSFDELQALRNKRSRRREISSQIFMLAIVLGISLFLYVLLTNISR